MSADAPARVNVSSTIDEAPLCGFHFLLAVLCGLVTVIDGYDLISMGIAVPSLAGAWAVEPSSFSPALSAALVGVLFGSAAAGLAADRYGRRWTLVCMLAIAAAFMAATSTAQSMNELVIYRFITGFGAGGSIPIAVAYTAEFMPARYRTLMVMLMYSGAPLGTMVGGFAGPALIETFQWPGIFYAGAAATLGCAIVLALLLPESVRFQVANKPDSRQLVSTLRRLRSDMSFSDDDIYHLDEVVSAEGGALRELFSGTRTAITLSLWFIFFAAQFVIFFVSLWLPTVFTEEGRPLQTALNALAVYNAGAFVGAAIIGWFSDRRDPAKVLLAAFPIAAVALASLGFLLESNILFFVVAFIAGGAAIGTSLALGPLAAGLYPTRARSTGVGWGLGVGRAGSIIAPFAGGALIAAAVGAEKFFLVAAAAPATCTVGILLLLKVRSRQARV